MRSVVAGRVCVRACVRTNAAHVEACGGQTGNQDVRTYTSRAHAYGTVWGLIDCISKAKITCGTDSVQHCALM